MTTEEYSNRYAKQHAIYERRAYPVFLRALHDQVQPSIDWIVKQQEVNPPLDALVVPAIWRKPMIEVYQMIGMLAAKREYFNMVATDKGVLDFLVAKWRAIFYEYALNYSYRIENELSETTKETIRRTLAVAYEMNLNADQTAALIRKQVYNEISRSRAVMISRTETSTAANLGKDVGARQWLSDNDQKGYKQYIGREDSRERGRTTDTMHWHLNDTIIPIDDNFTFTDENGVTSYAPMPGSTTLPANQRINCFIPDSITSQKMSTIKNIIRSSYSGQVITIHTSAKKSFTCTPNHPILTTIGWINAGELNESHQLVNSSAINIGCFTPFNVNNVKATFEQVFNSFSIQLPQMRVAGFFVNLYNRTPAKHVDIISVNRGLLYGIKAIDFKLFKYKQLFISNLRQVCCFAQCLFNSGSVMKFFRHRSNCLISFLGESLFILKRNLGHSQIHRLASISASNAVAFKPQRNRSTSDIKNTSDSLNAFSAIEKANNRIFHSVGMPLNKAKTQKINILKNEADSEYRDRKFFSDLVNCDTRFSKSDNVVRVEWGDFNGHVYTFETVNQIYDINSYVAKNCRCTLIYMSARRYERMQSERQNQ